MITSRRELMKLSSAALVAMLWKKNPLLADEIQSVIDSKSNKPVPKRPFGKTGISLSVIGFGGIVVMNEPQEKANKLVATAVADGVNYFDVAPSYGNAEQILGPALEPFRKDVFLACKTHHRDAAGAKQTLDQSLKNLRTDYFDLYQLHAITDVEKDVKACFAKGGALEPILQAKKAGIIRYIGFSAHSAQAALAAMEMFEFDSILYPVNFVCHFKGQFDQSVLEKAHQKGVAILTLKAIARQKWQPQDTEQRNQWPKTWYEPILEPELARLALTWTLSQRGVVATVPPGVDKLFELAVALAKEMQPMTDLEIQKLQQLAEGLEPLFENKEKQPQVG